MNIKDIVLAHRVRSAFVGGLVLASGSSMAFALPSTDATSAITTGLSGFLGQVWSIADVVLPIAVGVWLLRFGWNFARGLIH